MSKHTPTPWEVHRDEDGHAVDVYARQGRKSIAKLAVNREERDANAEFIVRACNAHDALLAALENFLDNPRGLTERQRFSVGREALSLGRPNTQEKR